MSYCVYRIESAGGASSRPASGGQQATIILDLGPEVKEKVGKTQDARLRTQDRGGCSGGRGGEGKANIKNQNAKIQRKSQNARQMRKG